MIKKGKETFSGYNKPKRTPSHPTKSHAVLAKEGDQEKLIRFGQKGVSGDKTNTTRNKEEAKELLKRIGIKHPIKIIVPQYVPPAAATEPKPATPPALKTESAAATKAKTEAAEKAAAKTN